jgi:isoleucyl-tRNA synthetase
MENIVILAEYVSDVSGTGLVHNAPDFGNDDYLACLKYNIKPFSPIDNYGKYNNRIIDQQLINVYYEDANKIIIAKLQSVNAIIGDVKYITHSSAHD